MACLAFRESNTQITETHIPGKSGEQSIPTKKVNTSITETRIVEALNAHEQATHEHTIPERKWKSLRKKGRKEGHGTNIPSRTGHTNTHTHTHNRGKSSGQVIPAVLLLASWLALDCFLGSPLSAMARRPILALALLGCQLLNWSVVHLLWPHCVARCAGLHGNWQREQSPFAVFPKK